MSDVKSFLKNTSDDRTILHLHGLRVLCLEKYTATYQVEAINAEHIGDLHCLTVEGYFRTLDEATAAFRAATAHHKVMGVRPGPRILPDSLRRELREAKEKDLFLLQNQLLGRLAEGLIALDQASNLSEARLSKLAGVGVFVSWWWSLTGHLRRELVNALRDAQLQQAIRIELMDALLEVQRAHILGHDFFKETLFANHAKRVDEFERDQVRMLLQSPRAG